MLRQVFANQEIEQTPRFARRSSSPDRWAEKERS